MSRTGLTEKQCATMGHVRAATNQRRWYRASGQGERVTLASLYRCGLIKRRAWRGKEGEAAAAHEYRAASLQERTAWDRLVRTGRASRSTVCHACGTPFQVDAEHPELEDRVCSCVPCAKCGKEYAIDDDEGPRVAPEDEEARMDGWCSKCMTLERAKKVAYL